jgi:DHA3 family macrolide efflux protein-like MFS transporter
MFLRALSGSVQSPAVSAIIPRLVPAEHLTRVNAINSSIQSAVNLVSPLLSGAILSLLGLGVTFFIDVITAAISIVIVFFFVHEPLPKPGESAKSDELHFFIDLREGLRYAGSHRFLKQLFIFTAFIMFCSVPMAFLAALQVSRDFGNDVWRLTALEFTYSVGELAGGVALSVWGGLKNRAHTMFIACLLMGASCAGMGLIPFFIPYLACMGVIGVSMPFYHTPVAVILQERIEDAYLGRVFGFFNTITCLTMPIGMMILGPLADKVNINYLFSACGAGMLMLGFFFILSKTIRAAGLPVQKPKL